MDDTTRDAKQVSVIGLAAHAGPASSQNHFTFGADHHRPCPQCGGRMSVTRRSPHPDLGGRYELQTMSCARCEHTVPRSVDGYGNTFDGR